MPVRVFLRHTPQTQPDDALRVLARSAQGNDRIAQLHDLMHRVRDAIAYAPGTTQAHTTAADALANGRGVCQDHAHVFVAACRSLAIPARYVTGYFVTNGEMPAEAHHAWTEAYVDHLGWIGFDVTNGLCPDDRYIRLACGLDADDAAPIRGSRRGGGPESLDVDVVVGAQTAQQ